MLRPVPFRLRRRNAGMHGATRNGAPIDRKEPVMLFYDFALVCERLAATTKKLEKAALLNAYFATLPDDDLALAARFLAGRPFALADERVLNVGWAVVRDVVCELSAM